MIAANAAVLRDKSGSIGVEAVEFDAPREREVAVRLVATALCHTDLHNVHGTGGVQFRPLIPGHEGAGIVEEVGAAVTAVQPGDKVIFSFTPFPCGHCFYCLRNMGIACEEGSLSIDGRRADGTFRARLSDGSGIGQLGGLGLLTDRVVCNADLLVKVHPDTNLRAASLLSCGFLTGAGAAVNVAAIEIGEAVAVIGLGGVGMSAVQGALVSGAAEVIGVDVHDHKLELSRQFGVTATINAREQDWVAAVLELTGGRGVDKALLCVPKIASEQMVGLVACLRIGGMGVIIGQSPGLSSIDISPWKLVLEQKTIAGGMLGNANPLKTQLTFLELYRTGRIKLDEMITATYPLAEIGQAFADLEAGKNIRGVIEF